MPAPRSALEARDEDEETHCCPKAQKREHSARHLFRRGLKVQSVKHKLAQSVIDLLGCSKHISAGARFNEFTAADWQRTIPWLHDTGLALYFLQQLKDAHAIGVIPSSIIASLEGSLHANRERVKRLAAHFDVLNRNFDKAGVVYAAVKGLSLVPEFCPDADLRHQSDFDYVVSSESLARARSVLEGLGYSVQTQTANDYLFSLPYRGFVATVKDQYNPDAPCPVELHLSLWDSNARDIFLAAPQFSVERTIERQWQGLTFRGLRDEIQFLFQVTHFFQHISSYWVRLSWLLEIAYFLNCRGADTALWMKVEQVIGGDPVRQEVVALVAMLAQTFFAAPLPLPLARWSLRPSVRVWIEKYSRSWAFGNNQVHTFTLWPTAKLTLFLLQQYAPDPKQFVASRLFPSQRLKHLVQNLTAEPGRLLDQRFRRRQRLGTRAMFHLAANLRYVFEQLRWRYLNRAAWSAGS